MQTSGDYYKLYDMDNVSMNVDTVTQQKHNFLVIKLQDIAYTVIHLQNN